MTEHPRIIEAKKQHRKEISYLYLWQEAERKLQPVIKKYDLYKFMTGSAYILKYVISKDDDRTLTNIAWSLFEEIDEILEMTNIKSHIYESSYEFDIVAKYAGLLVRTCINFQSSKNCKLEYEKKVIEVPKLVCGDEKSE